MLTQIFSIEVELNLPERIDFSQADKPLRDIAYFVQEQIKIRLRGGRDENLERPYDFRGYRIKRLAAKTINDKIKEGIAQPEIPLIRSGQMINSIRFRRIHSNEYQLYLPAGRNAKLARIHQVSGASRKKIRRPFLGMTRNDLKFAQARLIRWCQQISREIAPKYIRRRIIKY